jgi:hypothetical protein
MVGEEVQVRGRGLGPGWPGDEADRIVGPGQEAVVHRGLAAGGPQLGMAGVILLGAWVPVGERGRAGPQKRLGLGELVPGLALDLVGVDGQEVPASQ